MTLVRCTQTLDSFLHSYLLTYSMEQCPSWDANRFSASQETLCILWNPKVHYRIRKWSPPLPILSHINSVHNPTSHILKINLNIILSSIPGSSKCSLSLRFPQQNPMYISTLPHTCYMPHAPHLSRFDHLNIQSEEHRSLSSSLCSFLHSPVTLSFLGPTILLTTLLSNTLSFRSSPNMSDQVLHTHKTTGKIIVLYVLIFNFLDGKLEDRIFCNE